MTPEQEEKLIDSYWRDFQYQSKIKGAADHGKIFFYNLIKALNSSDLANKEELSASRSQVMRLQAANDNLLSKYVSVESDLVKAKRLLKGCYINNDSKIDPEIEEFIKGEQSTVKPEQTNIHSIQVDVKTDDTTNPIKPTVGLGSFAVKVGEQTKKTEESEDFK